MEFTRQKKNTTQNTTTFNQKRYRVANERVGVERTKHDSFIKATKQTLCFNASRVMAECGVFGTTTRIYRAMIWDILG